MTDLSTQTVDRGAATPDLYPTRLEGEPRVIPRRGPVVHGACGPLDAAETEHLERTGYLSVSDLVTAGEVQQMRDELERLSQDPAVLADERTIVEAKSNEVRTIFEVHESNALFGAIARDPRVVDRARQVLGSEVYLHQSRVNFKPAFEGKDFSWHSDFETWHAEDGMPGPRAISFSISMTDNYTHNGPLLIMPGSHREFVSCVGATPDDNYKESLVMQGAGTPDRAILRDFADRYGIDVMTGRAGGATMFDANCMHASNGNVTPYPRSNLFLVFNSVENACVEPFASSGPRPSFLAARDHTPVG